jgi:hypothetical protein
MARHDRIRPSWSLDDVPTPSEVDEADQHLFECINGDQGGTYAPSDPIEIGGAGLKLTGGANHALEGTGTELRVQDDGLLRVTTDGEIQVSGGGQVIVREAGSALEVREAAALRVDGTGTLSVQGGAIATVTGSGSKVELAASATLETKTGGRIVLGDSDWPTFSAVRTRTRAFGFNPCAAPPAGWTHELFGRLESAAPSPTTTPAVLYMEVPAHNGARLLAVGLSMAIGSSHFPADKPSFDVVRLNLATNAYTTLGLAVATPSGTDAASYYSGGANKIAIFSCGSTAGLEPMNAATYRYFLSFIDEHGAGALAGNKVNYAYAIYDDIVDMRFP